MLHAVPRATNVPVEFGSPNEGFRVAGVGKTRFWEVCARAICFGALRYGAHTKLPKRPLTLDSQWKLQKLANPGINPVNSPYEACRSLQEYPALGRFFCARPEGQSEIRRASLTFCTETSSACATGDRCGGRGSEGADLWLPVCMLTVQSTKISCSRCICMHACVNVCMNACSPALAYAIHICRVSIVCLHSMHSNKQNIHK